MRSARAPLTGVLAVYALLSMHCNDTSTGSSAVNTTHLDHLYAEVVIEGDTVGVIHIYADAPDYAWVGDDDEGIACVDDVARAAIFYLRHYHYRGVDESRIKAERLLRFVLRMQAPNGYFYNFIWPDYTIHRNGITTRAEPNWWSWRALWAFSEALRILPGNTPVVREITSSQHRLIEAIMRDRPVTDTLRSVAGLTVPGWLPNGAAADQAAIMMLGLSNMYAIERDTAIAAYLRQLGQGIMHMQLQRPDTFPGTAFLCWENLWHAYGADQSYALLRTGEALQDTAMINAALDEVDQFHAALLSSGGMSSFRVRRITDSLEMYEKEVFPQIAYGQRPLVWAALEAWKVTGKQKYLEQAREAWAWFSGDNLAGAVMYDPQTGRGYDGINSATNVNLNAGAESTIEALLALLEVEKAGHRQPENAH